MKKCFLLFFLLITFNGYAQVVFIDDCESLTGWGGGGNALSLDADNPPQGTYSIKSEGGNTERFRKNFAAPLNTGILPGDLTISYLQFSLYVSDITKLSPSDGQFEITSSGQPDTDEYSWNTGSVNLRNGWNNVVLRLSGASKSGTPNLAAINFFRYYKPIKAGESVVFKIDNMRFTKGYDGSVLSGAHIFNNADVATNWSGSDPVQVDNTNKILGVASLSKTGSGADWFVYQPSSVFNTTVSEEKGQVKFWLYVSDVTKFSGAGSIAFSSSGSQGTNEYKWNISSLRLLNGWNHVFLRISEATKQGTPNLAGLNYMLVRQPLSGSITAKVDEIEFFQPQPATTAIPLNNTLDGKVMFGYQGWFGLPDDGQPKPNWWLHWFGGAPQHNTSTIDMWPYLADYPQNELAATSMSYSDGSPAKLFSSYNYNTVDEHFKWMEQNELDGVFQQRFLGYTNTSDTRVIRHFDKVIENVQTASSKYNRVYSIMYDLSGANATSTEAIIADWKRLVDQLGVTTEDSYLWHKGKPLVALWGLGLASDPGATPERSEKLVRWFKEGDPSDPTDNPKYRATIMGGLNNNWRSHSAAWLAVYDLLDAISPWSVGRYGDESGANSFAINTVRPDMAYLAPKGIDYMPVIFPGFSWFNLQTYRNNPSAAVKNSIPRNGGSFLWQQSQNVINEGAKMVYLAMFDEVDEATSFFKMAKFSNHTPKGGATWFLALDADGYDLTPDWYMGIAGYTKKVLAGKATNSLSVPLYPNVITTDQGNPLPVTLTTFAANREDNTAQLNWKTTSETNSAYFEIQRSMNSRQWTSIGRVDAQNNSATLQPYHYSDANLPSGNYYYRLKMVDLDETSTLSKIVTIKIVSDDLVNVYPNPVSRKLTIHSETKILNLEIVTSSGRKVYSAKPENTSLELDVTNWPVGIYILKLNGIERKFLKQ